MPVHMYGGGVQNKFSSKELNVLGHVLLEIETMRWKPTYLFY